MLRSARPRRMRFRIDVEVQGVPRLAPRGTGRELSAVGHDDLDGMIGGMNFGFHGSRFREPQDRLTAMTDKGLRLYIKAARTVQQDLLQGRRHRPPATLTRQLEEVRNQNPRTQARPATSS